MITAISASLNHLRLLPALEPYVGMLLISLKSLQVFHQECMIKRIETRWNGPRIVFNFCMCPLCKKWLVPPKDSTRLVQLMQLNNKLHEDLKVLKLTNPSRLKSYRGYQLKGGRRTRNYWIQQTPTSRSLSSMEWLYSPTMNVTNALIRKSIGIRFIRYFGGLKNCQLNIEDDAR